MIASCTPMPACHAPADALAENGGKKRKGRAVDAEDEPLAKKPRGQPKAQPKPMTSQGLQKVKRPRGRPRKALLPQAAAPPSTPQQVRTSLMPVCLLAEAAV